MKHDPIVKIDIIFPRLPPEIDGIGDHTYHLAQEFARRGNSVRVLTGPISSATVSELAMAGVEVVKSWPNGNLRKLETLVQQIAVRKPDYIILQFEQFSYGRRGYNPELSRLFIRLRKFCATTKFVLYLHENYTKPTSFKKSLMSLYQRHQLHNLAKSSSNIVLSTDAWRNPRDFYQVKPVTIPVFSNIPLVDAQSSNSVRDQFHIPSNEPIVVHFGNFEESRAEYVKEALVAMSAKPLTFMYLGKDTTAMGLYLGKINNVRFLAVPAPKSTEVSKYLSCADISLAPFSDGVTTRRGSFLAALQHGIPTVTTLGSADDLLEAARKNGVFAAAKAGNISEFANVANELLENTEQRTAMSVVAAEFYEDNFTVEGAVDQFQEHVMKVSTR